MSVGEAYGFASHAGGFGGSWQSLELLLEYICSRRVMFAELRNAWLEGKAAMQGVGQEGTIHVERKLEPELRTGKTLCYCVEGACWSLQRTNTTGTKRPSRWRKQATRLTFFKKYSPDHKESVHSFMK